MGNLNNISKELFEKLRGKFSPISLGTEAGEVTSEPEDARYFNFKFKVGSTRHGDVTINLDKDNMVVIFSKSITAGDAEVKDVWFEFLKELRFFSKKNMLNFDIRDINKKELSKRDFRYMSRETKVSESIGSPRFAKKSTQRIGNAVLTVIHTEAVDADDPRKFSKKVSKIFIESPSGERFKYPMMYINGARAMAMHVSEGGIPYDEFGTHILSLAEEMKKLKKFKNYTSRSKVMAEGLREYAPIIEDRIKEVKKVITKLQKKANYDTYKESYSVHEVTEVPEEVSDNWIDQLTIKQFNEELKDIFPYVYSLISEKTKARVVGYDEIAKSDTTNSRGEDRGLKTKSPEDLKDFIMSYYDRASKTFPKGETAILTKVEKQFGEKFIEPSKKFIKKLTNQ